MLSKEAQAACQEVGGYLVEPRSVNKEADLEDVAEVNILLSLENVNGDFIFSRAFSVYLSPRSCTILWLPGPGGLAFPSKKVKVQMTNGFGHPTTVHLTNHSGHPGR